MAGFDFIVRVELTSGFSLANARTLLACSAGEYCDEAYEGARTRTRTTEMFVTRMAHGSAVVVDVVDRELPNITHTAGAVVLAWRGSASVQDWITDGEFWRVKLATEAWPAGTPEVHCGFWEAFKSVNEALLLWAEKQTLPIFVTGHSLGAAMAVLSARMLERNGFGVEGVYTFGGPRVGNVAFAKSYDEEAEDGVELRERTWRVVNGNDVVPRAPGVLAGYRHVGTEVLIAPDRGRGGGGGRGRLIIGPGIGQQLWSDVVGGVKAILRRRDCLVRDHFCRSYGEGLGNL